MHCINNTISVSSTTEDCYILDEINQMLLVLLSTCNINNQTINLASITYLLNHSTLREVIQSNV